ncbi:DMT family transporter [Blastococcus deserti]|uniref:DMT family transporter n=1 Tax=Blastococcus deserti TaxID=2259033 RepID=A0ABW4XEA8_9ACTN
MVYLLLTVAIAAEVLATSALPRTAGFTLVVPSVVVVGGYGFAAFLLAHVVKSMPVGIAYAIWAGVGTLTVVAVGATFLGQPISTWQVAGILLIVAGVVLVNLGGQAH